MSKKKELYKMVTNDGTIVVTDSIETYQRYIRENPHLFDELPIIPTPDTRYNTPKEEPSVDVEQIKEVLGRNEIYRRAFALMQSAQRRQIGYGLEKYPEPLNQNTWSTIETIDHIIDESIDKLHYLVMLRIKLEEQNIKEETTCCG